MTDLLVELPQLRTGAPVELEVEGDGIEVLSTRRRSVLGTETRWTVRVRPAGPPGSVRLILRAVYEDGESVPVEDTLTVVPAPEASAFPWLAIVAAALLAIAVAAMTLVLARRKP
ncbi:MAG: hypothetical protein M3R12_00825 [Actinomycetota bacterium]|nr:hypothetical protein [Actinomycetota bacterium]